MEKLADAVVVVAAALIVMGAVGGVVAAGYELLRPGGKRWRRIVAFATLPAAAVAFLAWDSLPASWAPTRCLDDASRRPTPNGVQLAAELCLKKYPGFRWK